MNKDKMQQKAIQKLQQETKRLRLQNEHLNQKFLQLHELLVSERFFNNMSSEKSIHFLPMNQLVDRKYDTLVLAFSGMLASGLGIGRFEFVKSFTNKTVSCVFFKDFHQCWYQKGLLGLTDNVYETKELIQSIVKDLAPRKVLSIGASSGGYAAIMFGVLLGVSKILAFSPQTQVGDRVIKEFGSLDTPNMNTNKDNPKMILDLVKLIEKNQDSLPETNLYFGELNKKDKMHAERLIKFQNINLHPIPEEDNHGIAFSLKKQGKLDSILNEFLS